MPNPDRRKVGQIVSRCAQLAALLEVSASPKPGNVHRFRDFPDTRYEHFLAGSVAIGPIIEEIARRSYLIRRQCDWGQLHIGDYILEAVNEAKRWQRGGNINLGIILLFSPIAASAGYTLRKNSVNPVELRSILLDVIGGTTSDDAVSVYEAIHCSMSDDNLGDVKELDVKDESSQSTLIEKNLSLLDIFRLCADRDDICGEWVSGFNITFSEGYSYLVRRISKLGDINFAVIDTFLYILSKHPDSLIRRKCGYEKALEVSTKAVEILSTGGSSTQEGRDRLLLLDRELHESSGKLNPGTTADLTASSIYVLLLEGWRP